MIGDVQCPLCGAPINVYKITQWDGMDGAHHEWRFRCFHCAMVNADYPADNFYGRNYFATKDDAIAEWNQNIKSFTKQAQIIPFDKIKEHDFAYIQTVYGDFLPVLIDEDGLGWSPYVNKDKTFIPFCERDEYGKCIVVWDGKPTDKQREAVDWNG